MAKKRRKVQVAYFPRGHDDDRDNSTVVSQGTLKGEASNLKELEKLTRKNKRPFETAIAFYREDGTRIGVVGNVSQNQCLLAQRYLAGEID